MSSSLPIGKQVLILLVLVALGYGGYEGYRRYLAPGTGDAGAEERGPGPATVEVASAERRVILDTVEAVGTTRARQSVEIVPETAGRITELAIAAGKRVEKGAVLVRLDDSIARADLEEARALLLESDNEKERMTRLRGSNAVAEAALEAAVARQAEARAGLDRAEQRLSERIIRAPFAGILGLPEVDSGARVSAGTVIARLDDLTDVEVEFSLPETLFARIRPDQTLTATSAAFPERAFEGRIEAVDSRIDPVGRSFRTRAIIPNPEGTLPAGMFMSLELTLAETERVVIPEEALVFQGAETFVFAVGAEGRAERRVVRVGSRSEGAVAILDGLAAGTEVVVRGLHRVRNGAELQILDRQPPEDGAEGADS